jgi:general stress protein 26
MPDSATKFRVGSQVIASALTAEQLPNLAVANDRGLVLKARDTNTSTIWLGHSKATAEAHHLSLSPGASIELYTDNLNDVWVDVETNADVVEYIVEVDYGTV